MISVDAGFRDNSESCLTVCAVTGGNICIAFMRAYMCRRWLLTEGRVSRFWQWRWTSPTGWRVTSLGGASTTGQTQVIHKHCYTHWHMCLPWSYDVLLKFLIQNWNCRRQKVWHLLLTLRFLYKRHKTEHMIPVLYVLWLFLPVAEVDNRNTKKWLESHYCFLRGQKWKFNIFLILQI